MTQRAPTTPRAIAAGDPASASAIMARRTVVADCSPWGKSVEEREVDGQIDRFLRTFEHPAGRARTPTELSASECARVA